jgi:hypothetical protein
MEQISEDDQCELEDISSFPLVDKTAHKLRILFHILYVKCRPKLGCECLRDGVYALIFAQFVDGFDCSHLVLIHNSRSLLSFP